MTKKRIIKSYFTQMKKNKLSGFTLIELIIVIVILGIVSVVALPRLLDLSSEAKIATLKQLAKQMKSSSELVRFKAITQGLRAVAANPGSGQSSYIVDFGFGSAEVDFGNLCPESIAEYGDTLEMLDFMDLTFDEKIETRVNNQYTLIGYDIPSSGAPVDQGCYVIYNSFGRPNCTIEVVTVDC
jgi:MSHA pilin protein MshA